MQLICEMTNEGRTNADGNGTPLAIVVPPETLSALLAQLLRRYGIYRDMAS